jgi:hypothetical protein
MTKLPSRRMKLRDLIDIVAQCYPDYTLKEYWDDEAIAPKEAGGEKGWWKENPEGGDSLARCICIEICETFDPDPNLTDDQKIEMALYALGRLADDIGDTMRELGVYKGMSEDAEPDENDSG